MDSRSDSGLKFFKSLPYGLARNIKQFFCFDNLDFNFLCFFFLFLLLIITFTSGLSQYSVIDGNYPTSPTLERCKGMGRGRTFGAKFPFAHQWHLGGSSAISGSFICGTARLLEIKDRNDSGRKLQCLFCRLGWFCLYVNHVIHMI